MKATPDEQLLVALQQTVSTALRHWLADNKAEILQVVREAEFESEIAKHERQQQQTSRSEFLTVTDVAERWQLHPESVRKMIRQGRIPALKVGSHNRVALSTVKKFEHDGVVPGCR
jgi:excisionase family DNA binding protein